MLGVFRLESQIVPGTGKLTLLGLPANSEVKAAPTTAFNYLKANAGRISSGISTVTRDYTIDYRDLQGLGGVPSDLIGAFSLIFYISPEDAVFKALGVE